MKKIFHRLWQHAPTALSRFELLLASCLFLIGMISITEKVVAGYTIDFFRNMAGLILLLAGFVVLNFICVPGLIKKQFVARNLLIIVIACIAPAAVIGKADLLVIPPVIFAVYTTIRYTALFIWRNGENIQEKYRYISPGVLLAVVLWMISLLFFFIDDTEGIVIATWVTAIPVAIALYSYSFYTLIPESLKKNEPFPGYAWTVIRILIIFTVPASVVAFVVTRNAEASSSVGIINFFFQIAVTVPFSWIVYKRYSRTRQEIKTLQKNLGQSVANFDFLRAQINPHFLFNSLNTLYGLAIQENASRTGEAIQRLGDMMRFMLHENMQEKIPLSREVEYLNNYIALQRLRTDVNHYITIEAEIGGQEEERSLSPMLLIPFVENAFKYGISFKDPSFIRITLAVHGENLVFKIHNSRHPEMAKEFEDKKNGLGIDNVKQRLGLFYPNRHRLEITGTPTSFLVYLSLPLSLPSS